MGSWHTLLQLTVPVLWTLSVYYLFNSQDISTLKRIFTPKGVWLVLLPVFILLVAYWVFRWIGIRFVDRNDRKRLFATWIVFGLVMIGLPALYLYFLKQSVGLPHTFIVTHVAVEELRTLYRSRHHWRFHELRLVWLVLGGRAAF
jgi:hypothetical protein